MIKKTTVPVSEKSVEQKIDALAKALGFTYEGDAYTRPAVVTRKRGRHQAAALGGQFYQKLALLPVGGVLDVTEDVENLKGLTLAKLKSRVWQNAYNERVRHGSNLRYDAYTAGRRTYVKRIS